MSTTDPSAAKPDDFAIGSISKRDRSGSGDEAAPVYPVKHPTVSYAGAAKGRPAAQSSNLFNYYSTSNSKTTKKINKTPQNNKKNKTTSLSLLSKFFENSQSQRREITCIRHLTMSTTDPSAAKPDGFAIGSIIYNVLNKQCIRHLTMSTTDPSAAKPDDFAIGSISKRDRSGSGDEAAPVYPVKHPTVSYAGAAKGRPAAQSSNLFNYYSTSNSKTTKKINKTPQNNKKNKTTSLSLLSKFFENSQSQRREITCIRHLTMSTTDPSAAKPDDFAIGSISKRDRSGSGDEAAPVYPVKHPTVSYAGAAKGRPAAQ
ncbi:hypothetical protein BB560_004541, partial [Smittium megazygosporum]